MKTKELHEINSILKQQLLQELYKRLKALNPKKSVVSLEKLLFPLLLACCSDDNVIAIERLSVYAKINKSLLKSFHIFFNKDVIENNDIGLYINSCGCVKDTALGIAFNNPLTDAIECSDRSLLFAGYSTEAVAMDNSQVVAFHSCFVRAFNNAFIIGVGNSVIEMQDNSYYDASGNCIILRSDNVKGVAKEAAIVTNSTIAVMDILTKRNYTTI
ncbi:MAG: hypothetical protein RSE25_09550 [Bacteroidales bacterium]